MTMPKPQTHASQALPGLVWSPEPTTDTDPSWIAWWKGESARDSFALQRLVGAEAWTELLRFEAWLGFALGFDGFEPILDPTHYADDLRAGPRDPVSGAPDGVTFLDVTAPMDGPYGLEGYLYHRPTGHVLRVHTRGLPDASSLGLEHPDLPVTVIMTARTAT